LFKVKGKVPLNSNALVLDWFYSLAVLDICFREFGSRILNRIFWLLLHIKSD